MARETSGATRRKIEVYQSSQVDLAAHRATVRTQFWRAREAQSASAYVVSDLNLPKGAVMAPAGVAQRVAS